MGTQTIRAAIGSRQRRAWVGLLDQDDQAAVMDLRCRGRLRAILVLAYSRDFTSDHVLLDSAIDQVTASGWNSHVWRLCMDAILLISSSAAPNPAIVVLDGWAGERQ